MGPCLSKDNVASNGDKKIGARFRKYFLDSMKNNEINLCNFNLECR